MQSYPVELFARVLSRLAWLADRRVLLLCVLLAANGLTRPYAGLIHDSRLYGAQVTEHVVPGTLAEDLFLVYGSQDRYTIFTPLMVPLVRLVGLEAAFFLVYLACKALYLWALMRFVFALIEERLPALLSLFYLSVAVLPFGGNGIFHLNETFLTPRLPGSALVLLALEHVLAGRRWLVLPLLGGALLLHPLMSFGGVLVVVLWWLAERLRPRTFVLLLVTGGLAGGLVVGYEPLGRRIFGFMDSEWRGINLEVCFFIRPSCWLVGDWLRTLFSTLVVGVAAWTFARPRAPLLLAVLLAGALGLVGSVVAVNSHYLLLIQASPYRTLWLVELLAIPLGFAGVARLWQTSRPLARCLVLALPLLLTADWLGDAFPPLLLFLALLLACGIYFRGLRAAPRYPDWLTTSALASFLITVVFLCLYNLVELVTLLTSSPNFYWDIHPIGILLSAGWSLFKLPFLMLILALALRLRPTGSLRWQMVGLLGFWASYQGLLISIQGWPVYSDQLSAWQPHGRFVTDHLQREAARRSTPLTVYWPADLKEVWFVTGVNSYFNWRQLSGCGFNRGTAVEGKRRGLLVRAFEMAYFGRSGHYTFWQKAYQKFYQSPDPVSPTEEDLLRICDEKIDFVVLEHRFPGLYSASDGCFFIYDCERLRTRRGDYFATRGKRAERPWISIANE